MHLVQGLGKLIVQVLCKVHQQMIRWSGNLGRINGSEKVSFKLLYILVYRLHFWYHKIAIKSESVLYTGQTKREANIWHNLGWNTIILFFNISNKYIWTINKLIRRVFAVVFRSQLNRDNRHDYRIRCSN